MADLLVSYTNRLKTPNTQAAAALDISTANRIKPFADKGTLLPSRIFGSPIEYAKDLGQDVVNISKGFRGKGKDHQLGRINDVGMKLGSLAIAAYLFAKNPLKLSKTMEFVGFGSFFASMALWPKLFIQLPLKLRTGVDIHRKYKDSENRKKMFFQDPKYVPWSLVSQEELDKIGDKNGISKDLPNRNDAIKATAQKVAVQGNTLWMMTAGFATPLMSSLMCSQAEKMIAKKQLKDHLNNSKTDLNILMGGKLATKEELDKIAGNLEDKKIKLIEKYTTERAKEATEKLNGIFETNGDKEMTSEVIENISRKISGDLPASQKGIEKYLTSLAKPTIKVNDESIEKIIKEHATMFKTTGIDAAKLKSIVETAQSKATTPNGIMANIISGVTEASKKPLTASEKGAVRNQLTAAFKKYNPTVKLPTINSCKQQIEQISSLLTNFNAEGDIVQNYINARVGQTPDSFIASQWQKVNRKLFDVLGITDKDLISAKAGGMETETLLTQKLEELAKDETKYKVAMRKMATAIDEYDKELSLKLMDPASGKSFEEIAHTAFDEISNNAAKRFKEAGMDDIAKMFIGDDLVNGADKVDPGSIKATLRQMTDYEMLGARSCFYRMFEGLDIFRRLQSGDIDKKLKALSGHIDGLDASPEQVRKFLAEKFDVNHEDMSHMRLAKLLKEKDSFARNMSAIHLQDSGKADWLIKNIDEWMSSTIDPEERVKNVKELFEKEFKDWENKKQVEDITAEAIKYVTGEAPSKNLKTQTDSLLEIAKKGLTVEQKANIQEALEKLFGRKMGINPYETNSIEKQLAILTADDKGKADWLIKNLDEWMSAPDKKDIADKVIKLFDKEFEGWSDKTIPNLMKENALNYVKEHNGGLRSQCDNIPKEVINEAKEIENFWRNIAYASGNLEGKADDLVQTIKDTIVGGKITAHIEKLFATPKEYKAIMNILYQQDFDDTTQKVLSATDSKGKCVFDNLRKGLKQAREDFIKYIGNDKGMEWRYKGRKLLGDGTNIGPDFKHKLVAKSLIDTIQDFGNSTFNSRKWIKMFGGAFLGLVGVTLAAELFFGRKDASIKGGNK